MKTSFDQPTISREAAQLLIETAIKAAQAISLKISVCVLDSSGRMKAFSSMDGAPAVSLETCVKKAKTAVGFGIPTGRSWHEFIKNDPILLQGAQHLPDFNFIGVVDGVPQLKVAPTLSSVHADAVERVAGTDGVNPGLVLVG
jgi:uncharacterized protein GlcG (DUF336 family)